MSYVRVLECNSQSMAITKKNSERNKQEKEIAYLGGGTLITTNIFKIRLVIGLIETLIHGL